LRIKSKNHYVYFKTVCRMSNFESIVQSIQSIAGI